MNTIITKVKAASAVLTAAAKKAALTTKVKASAAGTALTAKVKSITKGRVAALVGSKTVNHGLKIVAGTAVVILITRAVKFAFNVKGIDRFKMLSNWRTYPAFLVSFAYEVAVVAAVTTFWALSAKFLAGPLVLVFAISSIIALVKDWREQLRKEKMTEAEKLQSQLDEDYSSFAAPRWVLRRGFQLFISIPLSILFSTDRVDAKCDEWAGNTLGEQLVEELTQKAETQKAETKKETVFDSEEPFTKTVEVSGEEITVTINHKAGEVTLSGNEARKSPREYGAAVRNTISDEMSEDDLYQFRKTLPRNLRKAGLSGKEVTLVLAGFDHGFSKVGSKVGA